MPWILIALLVVLALVVLALVGLGLWGRVKALKARVAHSTGVLGAAAAPLQGGLAAGPGARAPGTPAPHDVAGRSPSVQR